MTDQPRGSILVVDDEAHIRHVVALKFRNAGFEVTTASDGEEGLETARRDPPDLIIVDLQMPYMTGLEMCAALAEDGATASIPAIMLTARGFGLTRADTEGTIIRQVLSKPFGPRQLLESAVALLTPEQGGREAA